MRGLDNRGVINVSVDKKTTCPITGGKEKEMNEASFLDLCQSKQNQKFRGVAIYKQCQECQGETIPAELTITREEEDVARDKEKKACELCGQVKQLSTHFDKLVCSSCQVMRGVVKNRPESVFACIRDLHDITEFLTGEEKHKVIVTSKEQQPAQAVVQTVIHADVAELEAIKKENVSLKKTIASDREKIADISKQVDNLRQLTTGKDFQTSALMTENDQLRKQNSLLKANINNTGYDKDKVMTVLVDIAQAHIDGRLVVKPEHFKELRKAATA